MPEPIIIVEYNPDWPQEFEKEASKILHATGHKFVAVEHIGSTAVPGLGAKPIIDMMAAVNLIADAHDALSLFNPSVTNTLLTPISQNGCSFVMVRWEKVPITCT